MGRGSGPSDVFPGVWGFLIGPSGAVLTPACLLPVHLSLLREAEFVAYYSKVDQAGRAPVASVSCGCLKCLT